jgi:hypothetical protein
MASSRQKLVSATNLLSKYYGLPLVKDLLAAESMKAVLGQDTPSNVNESDTLLDTLMANFVNSSSGALTSNQLINKLNMFVQGADGIETRLNEMIQVYFIEENLVKGTTSDPNEEDKTKNRTPINKVLQYEAKTGESGAVINSKPSAPSKEAPSVSVIFSNSHRLGLSNRDANPVSIFLNGMPNLEISRAVPFVDIQFFFARPPTGTQNRLQTLSLVKFLEGGVKIDNDTSPLGAMANAGQVEGRNIASGEPQSDNYATAGMELFTSPQSLVNANTTDDPELHSAPVLDKFRPLMTLQSLDITVAPSTGLMSFKTGTLKLVLHDRSRLAEVAEFVRADLYGKTEILIEYGWSHPEGNSTAKANNPYGDLINGMRVKEKFGVINSSFTFDDVGQIIISLNLAMRGAVDFNTELIASDSESIGSVIKEIEKLQELVGDYKQRVFGNSSVARMKEVRGVQILDAAQDAIHQIGAGKKIRKALSDFQGELKNSKNADATKLKEALDDLFAEGRGKKNANGKTSRVGRGGAVPKLRKKIIDSIDKKMRKFDGKGDHPDPWLIVPKGKKGASGRNVKSQTKFATHKQRKNAKIIQRNIKGIHTGHHVSLAKLILNFIAEPLANTGKFDDIQMIFYPFNEYAGKASSMNIGSFAVDLAFFTKEFHRFRMDHISKSGNMNLNDFLDFLGDVVLDDHAARSYGLFDDQGGALFKEVFNEDGTQRTTEIQDSVADYQARLEKILDKVTPDGSFKPPQVDFFVESVAEAVGEEDGQDATQNTSKTILRVHVFDRQATSYGSLQSLLASTRDAEIEAINTAPQSLPANEKDKGVEDDKLRNATAIIAAATRSNLIAPIKAKEGLPTNYRITGSPRQLKDFMMKTMPYVIYGTAGTTIKQANLSSMQDSALSTVNLLRSFNKSEIQPNGENPGSLPLRIIPTELTLSALGCPLINFAQQFFVDFQTGTTADAIYAVSGVTHRFAPGEFTTDIKMAPLDGWGRYMSLVQRVGQAAKIIDEIESSKEKQSL